MLNAKKNFELGALPFLFPPKIESFFEAKK